MTDQPTDETLDSAAAQRIEIIGDPTPAELAALLAVLSAASGAVIEVESARRPSTWSAPARTMRRPPSPGPGAWHHPLHA